MSSTTYWKMVKQKTGPNVNFVVNIKQNNKCIVRTEIRIFSTAARSVQVHVQTGGVIFGSSDVKGWKDRLYGSIFFNSHMLANLVYFYLRLMVVTICAGESICESKERVFYVTFNSLNVCDDHDVTIYPILFV